MDEDAWVVRHFASEGLELLVGQDATAIELHSLFQVSQSFGKNLGLYGDRIGETSQKLKCFFLPQFLPSRFPNFGCWGERVCSSPPKPTHPCLEANVNMLT